MASFAQNIKTLSGVANWAKIVGKPGKAYNPGEQEWSMDLVLDEGSVAEAHKLGMGPRIKNGVIKFTRNELKKGGEKKGQPNNPIGIKNADGTDWDGKKDPKEYTTLVGNGSEVKVKFNLYLPQKFGNKPQVPKPAILEVTVVKHVPYVKGQKAVGGGEEAWGEKV